MSGNIQNEKITALMNKVFNYINSNLNLKKDLSEYYKTLGVSNNDQRKLNNATINYIFERRYGENKKCIFEFVLSDVKDLTEEEKTLLSALKNSVDGIFEVRKITHDKFELFNIINEKLYNVIPMAKMTMFRNLSVGHFVFARLLFINGEYLLYHISDHVTYSNRLTAFQIAVSRLVENPNLFYFDNPDKFDELKKNSENLEQKFKEIFNSNYIITSNKSADMLIELLNDFVENNEKPNDATVQNYITPVDNDKYFDIKELNTNSNLFATAKKGFSAQNREYNVAIMADIKTGLQVVPFVDIFFNIFENDDYKSIENYKDCMTKFITESRISPFILQIANEKYGEKFLQRVNEILNTNYTSVEEILNKYKKFYLDNPYTSSTMTLYSSYAFKRLIEVTQEDENEEDKKKFQKVGRNDLCPCGSGLKYKKCCGKAVQI